MAGPSYYNEYLQYGVSHVDEFFYIFNRPNLDYSNWSEVNWFTSRAMSSMWGNFAKMGDPTPPGWFSTYFLEVTFMLVGEPD